MSTITKRIGSCANNLCSLHQAYIDLDPGCSNSKKYASLYWPDGTFRVIDEKSGRDATFEGEKGVRQIFDYAHSVFPLYQWQHSMGVFEISAASSNSEDLKADVKWKWRVEWKANATGTVSTGFYNDVFEKRDGVWKVLHRQSTDDPNWPIQVSHLLSLSFLDPCLQKELLSTYADLTFLPDIRALHCERGSILHQLMW